MIIRKEINIDLGRETELMMARMQSYDGKTVYSKEENKEFMGYELKPFQRRVDINKIDKDLEVIWEVGTQIVKHTRITSVYMESSPIYIPPTRTIKHDSDTVIPSEGHVPGSIFYYIDGTYCDEKMYNYKLKERQEDKELRDERLGIDKNNYDPFR